MGIRSYEDSIKSCYSTWSGTYYDDYYGKNATYPPVHRELIKKLLRDFGATTLLDAGCGPASFLREVAGMDMELYGFDLSAEMVGEGKKVFTKLGLPPERIWQGSVLNAKDYTPPGAKELFSPDAVVCCGVLPHIPQEMDDCVLSNLANTVKKDGLVIVEARNQLFALFTLNRYSYELFLAELIHSDELKAVCGELLPQVEQALDELSTRFRMDLPPVRKGKQGEPGYDEILTRTHNPFVLRDQFMQAGFTDVRLLFYHFHCLPPMLAARFPEFFKQRSLAIEDPEDWRGFFMASAFLLTGKRA